MLSALKEALARADPAYVAAALAAYLISVPLVALRWRTMLRGVTGRPAPLGSLVLATLASTFVNNMTPAARLGGEACRIVALVRLRLATTVQATAAAAYERLTEVPAVAVLALSTLFVVGRLSLVAFKRIMPSAFVLAGAALSIIVIAVLGVALGRLWDRMRARWGQVSSIRVARRAVAFSVLMSMAIWALDVIRLRLVAAAFAAPIGLPEAATLSAITIVAGWVPTIGGLGAIEGGLVGGLVSLGVAPGDALAITLCERAISYGIGTAAGFVSLSLLGGRSLWKATRIGRPVPEGVTT